MPNFTARSSASSMLVFPYAVLIAATVDAARRAVLEESATTMTRPTASTYGILGPDAVGRVFSLRRTPPADDLAHLLERHWVVRWDRGGRPGAPPSPIWWSPAGSWGGPWATARRIARRSSRTRASTSSSSRAAPPS